jgi:ribonuclease HI
MGEGREVRERTITGFELESTNVRLEMIAVLEGLRFFRSRKTITVYTDYENTVKMFNLGWIDKWAGNNWRKNNGKMVDNRDLVEQLSNATIPHDVTFVHVKGHTKIHYNEIAHNAAYEAAQRGWEEHQARQQVPGLPATAVRLAPTAPPPLVEGVDTPGSSEANLAPLSEEYELPKLSPLPPVPPVPDPPTFVRREYWAVFERKTKGEFFAQPSVRPMSPSESQDGERQRMMQAAFRMNNAKDDPAFAPEPGMDVKPTKSKVGGLPRFVALPFYWMADHESRVTQDQIHEIQRKVDDGASGTTTGSGDAGKASGAGGNVVSLDTRRNNDGTVAANG